MKKSVNEDGSYQKRILRDGHLFICGDFFIRPYNHWLLDDRWLVVLSITNPPVEVLNDLDLLIAPCLYYRVVALTAEDACARAIEGYQKERRNLND